MFSCYVLCVLLWLCAVNGTNRKRTELFRRDAKVKRWKKGFFVDSRHREKFIYINNLKGRGASYTDYLAPFHRALLISINIDVVVLG